jgi:hypothetical protein
MSRGCVERAVMDCGVDELYVDEYRCRGRDVVDVLVEPGALETSRRRDGSH